VSFSFSLPKRHVVRIIRIVTSATDPADVGKLRFPRASDSLALRVEPTVTGGGRVLRYVYRKTFRPARYGGFRSRAYVLVRSWSVRRRSSTLNYVSVSPSRFEFSVIKTAVRHERRYSARNISVKTAGRETVTFDTKNK